MATYYFDSVNGSDSNAGTSEAAPWANWENKFSGIFNGDTCYFKRGTTQLILTQFRGMRGGASAAAPSRFGAYGPAGPRPRFTYGGTPWGYILNGAGISNYIIEDIDFDGLGANSTIYLAAQGTTSISNWTFRRCAFHNAGANRSGLNFLKEATATTATATGLVVEKCDFYNNGMHGLISVAASNVRVRKSRAWGNGFSAGVGGGHGFSSRWDRSDVTSGWALVSGSIYSRGLTAAEQSETIGYVQTDIANHGRLAKNTTTPTAPGLYEYGVSAGTLYINIGGTPNGQNIRYAYHRCFDILYEDCESFGNVVSALSQYREGNGFALDDFTDSSTLRRCKSYNNEGRGYSINRGDSNTVEDCAAWGNGITGISSNTSQGLIIRRSSFVLNGVGNPLEVGVGQEMYFSPQVVATISSSVIAAQPGAAIAIYDDNFSTITVDKCSITGAVAQSNAIVPTNPILGNPKITSQGALLEGSPLIGMGTVVGSVRDVNRVQRKRQSSVGAYDLIRFLAYPPLV